MSKREEYSRQERVTRGNAAAAELPLLDEAFSRYKMALFEAWLNTAPKDQEAREHYYLSALAVSGARKTLVSIINDGSAESAMDAIGQHLKAREE